MNDIDKAQTILEGKCLECNVYLPKHTIDCSQNLLARSLRQIAVHLDNNLYKATSIVREADEAQLNDIDDIITDITKRPIHGT